MQTSTFFWGWMAALLLTGSVFGQNSANPTVAVQIDRYLDQRFDGDRAATRQLLKDLTKEGVSDLKDLERSLRDRRAEYPDAEPWLGKTTIHDVSCLHVDYQSRYWQFVPESLDVTKPVSLIVVGHGGNSSMSPERAEATARAYLKAYQGMGARMNAVLVAPASSRGWGQIGNSLILSTLSQVQRALPIDPDRIYLTGQSMGGHLSYRSALSLPDRFAAVSPHSGGYDFVAKQSIGNLINVPGYAVWGVREPYGINKDNRTNQQWATEHDLDWKFVEKNGGHEIYQDELPSVADFFAAHPRNLYRPEVYIRSGGTFQFVKTWQVAGWPDHEVYHETRPLRWNMRHWVEVQPRPELDEPLSLWAINRGDNQIEVTSNNVRELTVFFHPSMVDLERPVTIRVNGEPLHQGPVATAPELMFELAREFDDRGRVFWGRVDLQVATDRPVELPEK